MVRDNQAVEKVIVTLPEGYKRLTDCSKFQWKYSEVMTYLKDRGITKEMIDRYDIGYTTEGKYHDRIIIPSYDKSGNLDYYIARGFSKWTRPKYLNPDAKKSGVIFNSRFVSLDATIYLVEGVFDHMVIPNSIPMLGKTLSPELLEFLRGARANIVVVLDNDAIEDAKDLYKELNVSVLHGRLRLCELPEGRDPSKMFEVYGANGIKSLLQRLTMTIKESTL
jgi:DNA primase